MDRYLWKPYKSAARRRQEAARAVDRFRKKGTDLSPVLVEGRTIARTFWGKAWCDNLERYSDFANRLPRGRSYVRHGSVVDLQIAPGTVKALVSGSSLYTVEVNVTPLTKTRWSAVCRDCAGAIDSLIELLQGRFSESVMARICQPKTGLFPSPTEISFTCSCPDWAYMCKHVAAVLYGIGARLDQRPELLFALRRVDQQDLVAEGSKSLSRARKPVAAGRVLASEDLSALFGIDIAQVAPTTSAPRQRRRANRAKKQIGR